MPPASPFAAWSASVLPVVVDAHLAGRVNHHVVPGGDRRGGRIPGGRDVGVRPVEDRRRHRAVAPFHRLPVPVRPRHVARQHDVGHAAGARRRGDRAGSRVADGRRVEDDKVGEGARVQPAPASQAETVSGGGGHLSRRRVV